MEVEKAGIEGNVAGREKRRTSLEKGISTSTSVVKQALPKLLETIGTEGAKGFNGEFGQWTKKLLKEGVDPVTAVRMASRIVELRNPELYPKTAPAKEAESPAKPQAFNKGKAPTTVIKQDQKISLYVDGEFLLSTIKRVETKNKIEQPNPYFPGQ